MEGGGEGGEAAAPLLSLPSSAVGDLLSAYNAMRAFSWQLRLSPFAFPDFAAAMASSQVGWVACVVYHRRSWGQAFCRHFWEATAASPISQLSAYLT